MGRLKLIDSIEEIRVTDWDNFIESHPNGNIFQSFTFFNIYEKTKGYEPLALFVLNGQNEIVGLQLSVKINLFNNVLDRFSSRSIVFGGPLVLNDDPQVLQLLLEQYNLRIKNRVVMSQYRNMWDFGRVKELFFKSGFSLEDHLDILIDLEQGEEAVWSGMKSVRRKNIRKGYKSDLNVKELDLTEEKTLYEVYSLIKVVYRRIKLPLHPYSFFSNAAQTLRTKLVCIGLYKENRLIAARLVIGYKELLYDWYAGADDEFLNLRPNDILPWEVMKYGIKNSYKTFDFGGAGKPNIPYGVRDHKLKFGGNLLNFGRFEQIYSPVIYKLAVTALELKKKFLN